MSALKKIFHKAKTLTEQGGLNFLQAKPSDQNTLKHKINT